MTDEVVASRALVPVDPKEEFRRRLPPGWRIVQWQAHIDREHVDVRRYPDGIPEFIPTYEHRVLDVQLFHDPTKTEFTLRCTEAPDWGWLTEALVLAERIQNGVEISAAHGRWWF